MGIGSLRLVCIINLVIAPVGNVSMRLGCQGIKRKENLVEKLEFSIGWINKILRKRNVY